ncbi:MAG: hypothetical protein KA974_09435 [Saprospiraceae bacterium]|nr:hypothetical protein [Saprospiraceae bacterium]MBP7699268.1 hypothetical protein [Saprospiraceae bacterium]
MIKNICFLVLVVLVIGSLVSCKDSHETEELNTAFGYEYFPLQTGKYITYVVDSLTYDIGDNNVIVIDTSRVYIKEVVQDTFTDNLGNTAYRIERFTKNMINDPWQIDRVWAATLFNNMVFRIEDNLRFARLTFPARKRSSWDGNVFIDKSIKIPINGESIEVFKDWNNYIIQSVGQPEQIGDEFFTDVLTVIETDDNGINKVQRRYSVSKYAENIGLVYREQEILDTQCPFGDLEACEGVPWENKAEKGYIFKQTVIDFN